MKKVPEELYREREKRIDDAIQLKVPDRVPNQQHHRSTYPCRPDTLSHHLEESG